MTTSGFHTRLHAIELGELYWEHDCLTLRSLTPAQRGAQLHARDRLLRHARRVQNLVTAGQVPTWSEQQRYAIDGVADLMLMLWEQARKEIGGTPEPVRVARVPIPAPTAIWAEPAIPPQTRAPGGTAGRTPRTLSTTCRRCSGTLVRNPLAAAMGRPASQGWRHADSRKTHHPDPVDG